MRPALSRNVAASVVNAAAVVATSLVAVPLILDAVGTAGYGVWTLGLAIILYACILETGLGPAVQRFTAFARGREDDDALARLAFTTSRSTRSPGSSSASCSPRSRRCSSTCSTSRRACAPTAPTMFRILGGALALALLAAGTGNLAQGLERFGLLAASATAGALAFLIAVFALADSYGLPGLAVASCIGQGVTLLVRAAALATAFARPRVMQRHELRTLVGFSARLQVTAFSELVNWQSDKLVVGIVATPYTVGQLGIGAQFADGGRLLAGAALSPRALGVRARRRRRRQRGPQAALRRAAPPVGARRARQRDHRRRVPARADRRLARQRLRRGRPARRRPRARRRGRALDRAPASPTCARSAGPGSRRAWAR